MKAEYKQSRAANHEEQRWEKAKGQFDDTVAAYANGDCCRDCVREALQRLDAEDAAKQAADALEAGHGEKQVTEQLDATKPDTSISMLTNIGITLPAGDYYLGDPDYLLENPYEGLKGIVEAGINLIEHIAENPYFTYIKGGQTAVFIRTLMGDGIYSDEEGREYPVDTGNIGVVPVAMAHPDESRCSWSEYPDVKKFHRVTFPKPFLCKREEGGALLVFGDLEIDTVGFWAEAAESAEGYVFLAWDWKEQIDVEELNAALQKIPGAVVTQVGTGVDEYAVVVHSPTVQKTPAEWSALYSVHFEEEDSQ